MEVIVRNLHDQATEAEITKFFTGVLDKLGIKAYCCQKLKGRGCATITILDINKARQFLSIHGQTTPGSRGFVAVRQKLRHKGRPINCSMSNKAPDEFLLKHLQKEEKDRYLAIMSKKPKTVPAKLDQPGGSALNERAWDIGDLQCGQLTYVGDNLAFATEFQTKRKGRVVFGQQTVRVNLNPAQAGRPSHQIDIPYKSIESFMIGSQPQPSITFSLSEAPKIYERLHVQGPDANPSDPRLMLQSMVISPQNQQFKRKRITALSETHESVISGCLCYRLALTKPNDIAGVRILAKFPMIPDNIFWNMSVVKNEKSFADSMQLLKSVLNLQQNGTLPFELKFQMQKLAQNGFLSPKKVIDLLSVVSHQIQTTEASVVAQSVRRLCVQIPFPGPDTEVSSFSIQTLTDLLVKSTDSILHGELYSVNLADQYDHIASVHKIMVTPAGIYLSGPEPEMKNRVLRKYSSFPTHFLSVAFVDEDGEPLRLDRQTSGKEIYHGRYLKVLNTGIKVSGRHYDFLGFSHSSLRSQTSWFMAPFVLNGSLIFAQNVIQALGDFRMFRSPAKCAARIGQGFSQTFSSVSIAEEAFGTIPDLERNGRTFSDGVGTCSQAVLQEVWKKFTQARGLKPTVLQIRFQGAKGVISLDNRLEGAALRLRPSMIKFGGTTVSDIEICGAALKPLPMFLNRPLIKILEDLLVPAESFIALQADSVEKLRMTTLSAINASSFLERNFIGRAARLPWLLRKLHAIGFSFTDDSFLRNTLEQAVLIQLRELKYRSRIRVENGVTLYGIMDETDYLQEGQVYCSMHTERGGHIMEGSVVITRSPAMHPGDVQCVTAVDVPPSNPLCALHNVVVFSSHGQRDLPSQLSGGDLDGDLYNVIYDNSLYPKRISHPADYPSASPIDIGRPVERSDMTEFFVNFMENDNLGIIATLHQILADRSVFGTFDPVCIELAGFHSTAVDFSKTGIPVDFQSLPKYPKVRPDFLAPGPRVLIEKTINFEENNLDAPSDDDNDELEELKGYEPPKLRYYESPKVLGRLYREIDEQKFLEDVQAQSNPRGLESLASRSLVHDVWKYVSDKATLIQWRHYVDFAEDVKENYEENLVDTMYQYSTHPHHFISEIEVISGNILGKNGAQSKRQREFSKTMKEKYERDTVYTVLSITRGDDGNSRAEALERSIACLYVAYNTVRVRGKVGALVSFAWIAAAVCLEELEKLPGSNILL